MVGHNETLVLSWVSGRKMIELPGSELASGFPIGVKSRIVRAILFLRTQILKTVFAFYHPLPSFLHRPNLFLPGGPMKNKPSKG